MGNFQVRVMTKDLKMVKVEPICYDSDGFAICYVDEQGILHFNASHLCDLLKREHNIISVCGDTTVSDEDFVKSTEALFEV